VRYRLTPPTDFVSHCHCHSCRAASGAAFLTWTSVPRARLDIDGEPMLTWHRSSEGIRWGFCSTCGTTLFYLATGPNPEGPHAARIYVTVGSLGDPIDRAPSAHVSYEERVAWFTPGDHLPRLEGKTDDPIAAPAVHVILYVADQGRSRDFYQGVLGTAPRLDVPGMTEFALPGSAVLGLMPEAGIQRLLEGLDVGTSEVSRAEVYLRLPDAEAALARAEAGGGAVLSARQLRNWGEHVSYVRDPDGHILALAG
jgi:predicted enzyme related to lactoylglutathione lyase